MKQLILIAFFAAIMLTSCDRPAAGTMIQLHSKGSEIEVYQYYYTDSGHWVYVSRFKNQPQVSTTTWYEQHGKHEVKEFSISSN